MKKIILLLLLSIVSYSCKTLDAIPYEWLETNSLQKKQWLQQQQNRYDSLTNTYTQNIIDLYTYNENDTTDTLFYTARKKVGDYYVYINDKGVYYSKHLNNKNYEVFINRDSLHFTPTLIATNFSKYLIIKGSPLCNDVYTLQVWDLDTKELIKESTVSDYPPIQATQYNLYYSPVDKEPKSVLKKYNFNTCKETNAQLTAQYSYRVIDTASILTKGVHCHLYKDIDTVHTASVELQNTKKLQRFIDKSNGTFYFYTKTQEQTTFYGYNQLLQETHLIHTLKKPVTITQCMITGSYIFFSFIENGKNNLYKIHTQTHTCTPLLENELATIQLKKGINDTLLISYNSFTTPEIVYKADSTGTLTTTWEVNNPQLNNFKVTQKWVPSGNDSIPVIFYYKDSLTKSNSPLVLYGYGGFGRSITPSYMPYINAFVAKGVVYAIAGIRGGGEKGMAWHTQAMRTNKQQTFTDFSLCLDYIHANGISSPDKTAIMGASNGGLLINNAIVNYSQKFATAISMKGLSDMMNYPKYEKGNYWITEYGNPFVAKYRKYLKSYSPLHNMSTLPNSNVNILIITGDKDDRVAPMHSYKFAYGLQQFGNENVYLRVLPNIGHHMDKATFNQLYAEIFAFIENSCK